MSCSIHITARLVAFCIDLLVLPTHCSYALQPLNRSIFLPLKKTVAAEANKLAGLDPELYVRTKDINAAIQLKRIEQTLTYIFNRTQHGRVDSFKRRQVSI